MVYAVLSSGGKDSILACQKALDAGLDVGFMVAVRPRNPDSYMFHSANLDAVAVIASAAGMKYVEIPTEGEKEVELGDLEEGLSTLGCDGIVTGAVESAYQRDRLAGITRRLGLELVAPLWHMDPHALLCEVAERLHAIIVVTAADGLDASFLGARIDAALIGRLRRVAAVHQIHLAGEGGEYETLTLDAPFYRHPVRYESAEVIERPGRSELVLRGFS
ncbi:MAG TPA: diphthine--ammonia ligase [Methanoregulaceae archaeon]|nr:diphthine--ammonia ligase [Methanoregulaceae archaeon]HQJ88917.1 diphthine--ammonia ligase [Methanoregulaceae archaeon]